MDFFIINVDVFADAVDHFNAPLLTESIIFLSKKQQPNLTDHRRLNGTYTANNANKCNFHKSWYFKLHIFSCDICILSVCRTLLEEKLNKLVRVWRVFYKAFQKSSGCKCPESKHPRMTQKQHWWLNTIQTTISLSNYYLKPTHSPDMMNDTGHLAKCNTNWYSGFKLHSDLLILIIMITHIHNRLLDKLEMLNSLYYPHVKLFIHIICLFTFLRAPSLSMSSFYLGLLWSVLRSNKRSARNTQ